MAQPKQDTDAAPPSGKRETRPTIQITVGDPPVAAAIRALGMDSNCFFRDTELVSVTRVQQEDSEDSYGRTPAGTPRIHVMTPATIRLRLCQRAVWERAKENKEGRFSIVRCEPTRNFAEEVRDEKQFPGIRKLDGISETPFPRPDGRIVQVAGYDPVTHYLYEPSEQFEEIPEAPTLKDATLALEALEDLFVDFPFATSAGRAGAIAALLTLLCRPAIVGPTPAFVIDATTPGTGKSLLADVCAAIAYGRDSGRHHFPSSAGIDADSELSKTLAKIARHGSPVVNFDNADTTMIGGDVLEDIISTPNEYSFRILGKTDGMTVPWRTVIFVTANNADWTRGMNRRIIHLRLESPFEKPESRPLDSYVHPERAGVLFDYAVKHRHQYVTQALKIVRAYVVAGCPNKLTIGTFERWAALVPSAIVWAGGSDPLDCRPSQSGDETPDTTFARILVQQWASFCMTLGVTSITAKDVIAAVYPGGEGPPQGWEDLRAAIEHFIPTRIGQAPGATALATLISKRFKGAPTRTADAPAPLQRFRADGITHGRQRWRIEDVQSGKADRRTKEDIESDRVEREALRGEAQEHE